VNRPAEPRPGAVPGAIGASNGATEVVRSEEELRLGTEEVEVGRVRVRKVADHEHVEQVVSRDTEYADVERAQPDPVDSGEVETLPDGSLSIPLFEEQLVVEKRLVVRERVILRKYRVTDEHRVEADLRRERLEVDADNSIGDRLKTD
jgi:uncharacterized protein (TIGR02271 family)